MSDLKIIHVVCTPTGGGAELLVRELVKRMQSSSYESEAVYFNKDSAGANSIVLNSNETVLNVSNRDLKAIWKLRVFFKSQYNSNQKCIIHAHLTWPFFYVVFASIGLDVNLVYTEHNTMNKRRKIPMFKYIERFFYKRYKKIICISEGTKKSLDTWIGSTFYDKIKVVSNGARLYNLKSRTASQDNKVKFISVGSLNERKGFHTSIKALSLLKNIDWEYTIIGEGIERQNLQLLINSLGLKDKVTLYGWSNETEVFLYNADIQLIPSLWEGFGLVAVEGMSTGLPVVASRVDGLIEVIDENTCSVFLVDEYLDESKFSEKIEECVLKWRTEAFEMSRCSHDQIQKFSLDNMAKNYIEVYKELL